MKGINYLGFVVFFHGPCCHACIQEKNLQASTIGLWNCVRDLFNPDTNPYTSKYFLRRYLDPPGTHPKHLLRRYLEA